MVTDLVSWCRFAGALSVQDRGQGQPLVGGPWPLPLPEHSHGVSRQFTNNIIVYPTVVKKNKTFCVYSSASYIWFHRTGSPTAHVTVGIFLALIPVTKLTPTKNHFQCFLHILLKVLIDWLIDTCTAWDVGLQPKHAHINYMYMYANTFNLRGYQFYIWQ